MRSAAAQQYAEEDLRPAVEYVGKAERISKWTSQKKAKEDIQQMLDLDDRWVYRALKVIHSLQTEHEKTAHTTFEANKVGFGAFDAEFMTDMAEVLKKYGKLSPKQLAVTRRKIKHYWKQLMLVARGELKVNV